MPEILHIEPIQKSYTFSILLPKIKKRIIIFKFIFSAENVYQLWDRQTSYG
jgi:hypothetical protein